LGYEGYAIDRADRTEANEGFESRSQTETGFPGRSCPASNRQVLEGGEVMAITTQEKRVKHIHGLAETAKQIAYEEHQRKSLDLDLVFPLPEPEVGSTVTVQMYDGRKIQGVVKAIQNTVTGQKFQIVSGDVSLKVGIEQILDAR